MRILEIDQPSRTARVQPGVRNLAISKRRRLTVCITRPTLVPDRVLDRRQRRGNAGGMHCLKYGLTVHNILKLRAWTIEGELLEIGSDAGRGGLRSAGLMTGSEGMLAVVTEIT